MQDFLQILKNLWIIWLKKELILMDYQKKIWMIFYIIITNCQTTWKNFSEDIKSLS